MDWEGLLVSSVWALSITVTVHNLSKMMQAWLTSKSTPVIGRYRGTPIKAALQHHGEWYSFHRIAYEEPGSEYPPELAQMTNDEFMISPGLIYRKVTIAVSEWPEEIEISQRGSA